MAPSSRGKAAEAKEVDLTIYKDKPATALQAREPQWIIDNVGYEPNEAKTKREAFDMAVKLTLNVHKFFQVSDENRTATAEARAAKAEDSEARAAAREAKKEEREAKDAERQAKKEEREAERAQKVADREAKAAERAANKPAKKAPAVKAAPAKAPAKKIPAKKLPPKKATKATAGSALF